MANFCLPPKVADQFKKDLVSGKIDPLELSQMSSADRHAVMEKHFGDLAGKVNALFESKLLMKNQQAGMVNWAKGLLGISEPAKRDIISRIERMDKILTPGDEKAFLGDLAEQRLGVKVSYEEAQKIAELAKKVEETKPLLGGPDRMEYGRAVVELQNYVADLKGNANKFSMAEFKQAPGKAVLKGLGAIAGNAKAIKASMDNSAIFRQGWKTLMTHPEIWQANARQSFVNIVKTFGKDEVLNELNADIVSRPTYDLMRRAGLDVGVTEEAYPTHLPEKIPGLGKVYKASENAYTAFVHKTRADVFDKYIDIANKSGVDLNNAQLKSIGKLVNSLTGRGDLGRFEGAASAVNNVLFSPRFLKSNIDTLTVHAFDKMDPFARKHAALNLLKIIGGTAAVLATARALKKDSVELDPRSADFGKIRVGDTRFDVTGGMSSIATLAARELNQHTKSSVTHKVVPLNKFGQPDVIFNFIENKLSPAASVINDLRKGKTNQGTPPTLANESVNLFVPMAATNYVELKNNPNSANILLSMMADALGISTNTYSAPPPR